MTPFLLKAWTQGRLDARCTRCGETYPARRQCIHCGSRDMEFREHVPGSVPGSGGVSEAQWCQSIKHRREPDPSHPLTGTKRRARLVSPGVNASAADAVVSGAADTLWSAS